MHGVEALPGSRDLLGELHDEAVGVQEVQGAMTPRPILGPRQDANAGPPQTLGFRVGVPDEERHLPLGTSRPRLLMDQLVQQ